MNYPRPYIFSLFFKFFSKHDILLPYVGVIKNPGETKYFHKSHIFIINHPKKKSPKK